MLDAERVLALTTGTHFSDVRALEDVDSTNRVVREAADAGAPEGLVVVAEHQSAGRGRRGRRWDAPPGTALLVSILLRPSLPAADLHLTTAAVALAAQAACDSVASVAPDIKWPNDLLVDDAKLAGILAEAGGGAVIVGMGMNVSSHPEGATDLAALGWVEPDRAALLADVLVQLDPLLGRWDDVRESYRSGCATVGRRVRVELQDSVVEGMAERVDDHGHLVVAPDGGEAPLVLSAADVVHLRGLST